MPALRSIAVGFDGSEGARAALDWACTLAKLAGASLAIVCAVPVRRSHPGVTGLRPEADPEERRSLRRAVEEAAATARDRGVSAVEVVVVDGPAVEALVQVQRRRSPDLFVLGARGLSPGRRLLLGSVSGGLVRHGVGPVLIVRSPAPSDISPDRAG